MLASSCLSDERDCTRKEGRKGPDRVGSMPRSFTAVLECHRTSPYHPSINVKGEDIVALITRYHNVCTHAYKRESCVHAYVSRMARVYEIHVQGIFEKKKSKNNRDSRDILQTEQNDILMCRRVNSNRSVGEETQM